MTEVTAGNGKLKRSNGGLYSKAVVHYVTEVQLDWWQLSGIGCHESRPLRIALSTMCNFALIRGIFSVAMNFREATALKQ